MTTLPDSQLMFIDTNIWLYALITGEDAIKSQRARMQIAQSSNIVVSTQVINEICVNLIKREKFTPVQTRDIINDFYAVYTVVELDQSILVSATMLREQYSFSYWDSLIAASALESNASILSSEDMHDGLIINKRLTIVNPFT